MLPPDICSAVSITGSAIDDPSASRPCSSTRLARASGVCTGPLTRSIEGLSNTIEARSGTAGSPATLLRPTLQFTFSDGGWPRSAIVAGALNSAISSFGW